MELSAQNIKDLREKTGAGMMDCKKALTECAGDFEKAVELLRKQGLAAMAKKADRIATEGVSAIHVSPDGKLAVLLELNCETDFVAKNEDFKNFAQSAAALVAAKKPATVDELLKLPLPGGSESVAEKLNLLVAKIGEKMNLRRFAVIEAKNADEKIGTYIHLGSKIGVAVLLKGPGITDDILKDVAMHVAAAHPFYLNASEIPQSVLDKEKDIYREQLKTQNKPAAVMEKILEGKVAKYASEVCLNDQIFIKDPTGKMSIAKTLKAINPQLIVASFYRYQVGEGMEKKNENFADEVAKMAK